jgi:hypothetical protein
VLTGEDLPRFWAVASAAVHPFAQTAPLVIVPFSSKPADGFDAHQAHRLAN